MFKVWSKACAFIIVKARVYKNKNSDYVLITSGSGRTTHPWHDGVSHAPVWTDMDAYRVICHPGDEDEGARWACGARQQRGPVEVASGLAPAVLRPGRTWLSASTGGEIFLFLPRLARLVGLPNGCVAANGSSGRTDDGRVVRDFNLFFLLTKKKKKKKV